MLVNFQHSQVMLSDSQAQYMETTEATSASTSSPASSSIIGPTPSDEILPPRSRRLPARFRDILPTPPVPVLPMAAEPPSMIRRVILHIFDSFRTHFNRFGIAREYRHCPSHDPNAFLSAKDLSNFTRSTLEQVGHDLSARQEGPSLAMEMVSMQQTQQVPYDYWPGAPSGTTEMVSMQPQQVPHAHWLGAPSGATEVASTERPLHYSGPATRCVDFIRLHCR